MEESEYLKMAEVDDRMWWYRGLHRNVCTALRRSRPGDSFRLLDGGCGTGGLLLALHQAFPSARLEGVEAHAPAAAVARTRSGLPITDGNLHALPFPDACFDAVTVTDVLYHENADPARALAEIARVLKPGGVFVSSEVAFEWLRSYHDEQVRTARRFTRAGMTALLSARGLRVERATYWNFFLLPVLVLKRKILTPKPGESDVHEYAPWMDRAFGALLSLEDLGIRAGLRWPLGSSLLTVSRKSP